MSWTGRLHPGWTRLGETGPQVHGLHLPPLPWGAALGETALEALRPGLGADFMILRATEPEGRAQVSAFMEVLEGLLEVTQGSGLKLALRPAAGAAPALARRLREARGEAVGFCWDAGLSPDLAAVSDRLFCAVGDPADDFRPIQSLGYRWNLALPAQDPAAHRAVAARIQHDFPPVLFPDGLAAGATPAQREEQP